MTESANTVEQILAAKGEYAASTVGISMYPLLRDKRYAVKIVAVDGWLKPYDVALFRRGRKLVLHRVIKVLEDGYYIRGDNCETGEFVPKEAVIGVLSEIRGKNKCIKTTDKVYRVYARMVVWLHPCRLIIGKLHRLAKRLRKGI